MTARKGKGEDAVSLVMAAFGAFLMAVGINLFYEPASMVTGGVTGLAIVIEDLSAGWVEGGIPIWLTNLALNALLFLGSARILGKEFLGKTICTTLLFSAALYLVPVIDVAKGDYLLASVFGAIFSGVGIGLVFAGESSTGGTDVLGTILHKYLRQYSIAQIIMVLDGAIVLIGAIVYGLEAALYAMIAVYITSKMTDGVLEGFKFAKLAFIISERYDEIAEEVLRGLRRGITGIPAKGMYSNAERQMLVCAVSKKEITALKDIVAKHDPRAFMIVTDAREVMGEGFIEYKQ